jgi:LysR family transcriptional activator of nhaA
MDWLNYHHLFYFWTMAREGSIAAAARRLRLSQPTVSEQLGELEKAFGEQLFQRTSRGVDLTEQGTVVFRYADEIFALGRELSDTLKGRPTGRPARLVVGVADVIPKLVAYRLIKPALSLPGEVRVVCHEDKSERLFAELAIHGLDVVIADAPLGPSMNIAAYNHLLGECGVAVFGEKALAARYRRGFPRSLDGAPFLMPLPATALRRSLDQWFEAQGIKPRVVGEFQDSALLETFGQAGLGLFAAPSAVLKEIKRRHGIHVLGRINTLRERYYAISGERRLKHPAVIAISNAAKELLFEEPIEAGASG